MKRVVRLTESDLTRIVKRVIRESEMGEPKVFEKCSDLNGIGNEFIEGETGYRDTGEINMSSINYKGLGARFRSDKYKNDPYSYVRLNNGKICGCKYFDDFEGRKWFEITEDKGKREALTRLLSDTRNPKDRYSYFNTKKEKEIPLDSRLKTPVSDKTQVNKY